MQAPDSFKSNLVQRRHKGQEPGAPSTETRIGPVTLDWKVNVTAIIAFLFSASALYLQVAGYWKGAVPKLHPVDKVLINTDGSVIRIGARMMYTNDGNSGYNALILMETASFHLGNDEYRQFAEGRGTLGIDDKTKRPSLQGVEDAAPFMLPSMQLVTHESYFAPREQNSKLNPWKNRVKRDDFVRMLQSERRRGIVEFTFRAKSRQMSGFNAGNEESLTATCVITLDDGLIRRMKNEGWTSRSCRRLDY